MSMYRKKADIEATKFTGSSTCIANIERWVSGGELHEGGIQTSDMSSMTVLTNNGDEKVYPGYYVYKDGYGEFHVCRPELFEASYEAVETP